MSKKVCILGASLNTGNMGVSALSVSVIENVIERIPDAEVYLIIPNHEPAEHTIKIGERKIKVQSLNWRMSPRAKRHQHLLWIFFLSILYRILPFKFVRKRILKANPMLRTMKEAIFVGDIHGGDYFSDIYGPSRYIIGIIQNFLLILLKKPYVLLPQTYGPYFSSIARASSRKIMKDSKTMISRDLQSIELVKKLMGKKFAPEKVLFSPDVAFKLSPRQPQTIEIDSGVNLDQLKKPIGLNVSGLLYHGGYTQNNMFGLKLNYKEFARELILELLGTSNAPVLLIPHTYARPGDLEDDRAACIDVKSSLPPEARERVHVVLSNNDQNEVKWIIGKCDFFIGSRMHSCIAALSQGIPTIGAAYSKKFLGVFSSIESAHLVVDARHKDNREAVERIKELYADREKERALLKKNVTEAKKKLNKIFDDLLKGD